MRAAALPLLLVSALLLPSAAVAGAPHRGAGHWGIGVGGGTTGAGVSAKTFLSDNQALQGVVGLYGPWGQGAQGIGLNADWLWEMPTLAEGEPVELAWNAGLGAGAALFPEFNSLGVGVSGVLGLELAFKPVPLDLVIEYRPTLSVLPGIGLDPLAFTGHLRWFF